MQMDRPPAGAAGFPAERMLNLFMAYQINVLKMIMKLDEESFAGLETIATILCPQYLS